MLPELLEQSGWPPAQLGEEPAGDEAQEPRLALRSPRRAPGPDPVRVAPASGEAGRGRGRRRARAGRDRAGRRRSAGRGPTCRPAARALRVRCSPDGDPGVRLEVPREHLHRFDVEAERAADDSSTGASGCGDRHRGNLPKSVAAVLLVALGGAGWCCAARGRRRGVHLLRRSGRSDPRRTPRAPPVRPGAEGRELQGGPLHSLRRRLWRSRERRCAEDPPAGWAPS